MLLRLLGKRFRKSGRPAWLVNLALNLEDRRIARLPYYRLNPYHGAMSLRGVDQACVVDREHKVFFHRIPKNANSSLVTSYFQLMEDVERSPEIKDKRRLKKKMVRPSALSAEEAKEVDAYFKFLVVRNPYDRLLSAYLSKIVRWASKGKRTRVFTGDLLNGAVPTFAQFCEFLEAGGLYRNRHWTPQVDFLVYPKDRYDFIARLESIDKDFNLLAHKLGRQSVGSGMVAEDPKHRTGAAARRQEYYTEALYDLVYRLYRADFETFGYRKSDR